MCLRNTLPECRRDLCRKHGISNANFYKWRSRDGGMEIREARKLKAFERGEASSRNCWRSQCWDASTLKEMLEKNLLMPSLRK